MKSFFPLIDFSKVVIKANPFSVFMLYYFNLIKITIPIGSLVFDTLREAYVNVLNTWERFKKKLIRFVFNFK